MDAFPAFFPLAGRRIVIAGVGEAAEAKARLFAGSPAQVVRIDDVAALDAASYAGAALAFVASEDDGFAAGAAAAARAAHVPVNVVDRPALCDFTTPSVIDRGQVVAAIGTGGASPMLATMLRHDLEARIPEGAGRVAALFQELKDEVKQAFPDTHRRRSFLRAALAGPAARAALDGDMARARILLRADLDRGAASPGEIMVLDGRGPVDSLTLGAARLLAGADVVVCEVGVDAGVLGLARRDAQRLDAAEVTDAQVAALLADGQRVVRLTV